MLNQFLLVCLKTSAAAAVNQISYPFKSKTPSRLTGRFALFKLFSLREAKIDTRVAWVKPALGDGLLPSEEVHTLKSVRFRVAES